MASATQAETRRVIRVAGVSREGAVLPSEHSVYKAPWLGGDGVGCGCESY